MVRFYVEAGTTVWKTVTVVYFIMLINMATMMGLFGSKPGMIPTF